MLVGVAVVSCLLTVASDLTNKYEKFDLLFCSCNKTKKAIVERSLIIESNFQNWQAGLATFSPGNETQNHHLTTCTFKLLSSGQTRRHIHDLFSLILMIIHVPAVMDTTIQRLLEPAQCNPRPWLLINGHSLFWLRHPEGSSVTFNNYSFLPVPIITLDAQRTPLAVILEECSL